MGFVPGAFSAPLGVLGTSADFTEMVQGIPETVEEMRKTIRRTKGLTKKPFGINVFPEASRRLGLRKATALGSSSPRQRLCSSHSDI